MRVEKSFCRLCYGFCGMDVTVGEGGRVLSVKGDRDNPATMGYACVKGLDLPSALYGEKRILHPLKRIGDRQVAIPLEQALDEIADRMKRIADESGGDSLAFYRGTGTMGSNVSIFCWPNLAEALGAQKFSTMTIDQSAKWVAQERLGTWAAPRQSFSDADVWLVAGANPLVSVFSWDMPAQNPLKRIKQARARGMKLIVVDPRECEIAQFADIHLQPYPGEDAAIAAGLLNVILSSGWEDQSFCRDHVEGLEDLRDAVAQFTPDYVARRAGISATKLVEAARTFAHESKRGCAGTGTGVNMAAFPNLAEHLYQTVNVICGRFLREGEKVRNPGVLFARPPARAEAVAPERSFENGSKSRVRGAAHLMGESATPTLAEEILTPGHGQIRGLLVSGANPASAIPDSDKVVKAFRALDLLVAVEPFETETAKLADYVLPPKFIFEHADLTFGLEMTNLEEPYAAYTPQVAEPPAGAEVAEEGYLAWSLAKRMGLTLNFFGTPLDMNEPPSEDQLLSVLASHGNVPYEELKQTAIGGKLFNDLPDVLVEPSSRKGGRFAVMPPDVAKELHAFAASAAAAQTMLDGAFPLRLIVRRIRETSNTSCRHFPTARKRAPYNPVCIHPDDLVRFSLSDAGDCWIESKNGRMPARVKADPTLKPGVVSMTHGYGGLPDDDADYLESGSSTSPLISLDQDCEPLQAMPLMSGVPVALYAREDASK